MSDLVDIRLQSLKNVRTFAKTSQIQSVLFDRNQWELNDARKWLREHSKRPIKLDITAHKYRFRLVEPSRFDHFRIKKVSRGIEFVIGFPEKYITMPKKR